MPQRPVVLANNEIYHVFNRSIAKTDIFSRKINLRWAMAILDYYRFTQRLRLSKFRTLTSELKSNYLDSIEIDKPLVEIYAFALMPNHYHFLLKQIQDKGITTFISNFQNSFAKIFNLKNNRNGALFQNAFKAKRIEDDEQFMHVSRYVHLNPVTAFLIEFKDLATYEWTSFPVYSGTKEVPFINSTVLLKMLGSKDKYIKFVSDQADYQRELAKIKNLVLE